ncbi:MAG: hypothetical protein Nkreftii_003071 [Candidatus Nitrospira kreftii]|uniref:Uncharacterized protein n=1 Tax=Candidatus Nitrospira kreftii TaxID=2652173 RepID=A0A7S8IZL9_9BACT|nr:MAG: hypothetical protein Nkreftii_003071 [Candidatus Nitrospira kreftii]
MAIKKSIGVTPTERLLSDLCESTFLKLWSYPNPFKDDGKELCDLLVIFDHIAFIFFDREKQLNTDSGDSQSVSWGRWKRRVIDAQIKTAHGAEKYLRSGRKIYLENTLRNELPIKPHPSLRTIHKIIVAHGAAEACLQASSDNMYGSLAIAYSDLDSAFAGIPFMISLDRSNPVHVLDTHNLPVVLRELDTIWDLTDYLDAKVEAINRYGALTYCGEEDLLAHYFRNYDEISRRHRIGPIESHFDLVNIGEGEWKAFENSEVYINTKKANQSSYVWDRLIQRTSGNALAGLCMGDSLFAHRSPIHEMAKEPRFTRRALTDAMMRAIDNFPEDLGELARNISLMPSFYPEKRYLFFQLRAPAERREEESYRAKRQYMLKVACGAAKNSFPEIKTIIGIAIDAPKFSNENSEDFILMDCSEWTLNQRRYYEKANEPFQFFNSGLRKRKQKFTRFVPQPPTNLR